MKPKIFVTRLLPGEAMDRIRSFCEVDLWDGDLPPPREVLLEKISEVEGLLCLLTDRIDAELLNKAMKLRVISNYAVGFDNIDVPEATRRRILVTNTPGVLTETTADFAFALMMAAGRRIVEGDKQVRDGKWKTWGPLILRGQDIHSATLGIVGLGRIGTAVAIRAKGFGMKLLYHDPKRDMSSEAKLGIEHVSFDRLLAESDYITIHVNLTPATHHLFGPKELSKMKRTAILVNTARGPTIDNMALYHALRHGEIAFAALDVTEPEPIPPNHPLLTLSNVIITPHIASASVTTRTEMGLMAADNLIAALKGEMPPNPINPEVMENR